MSINYKMAVIIASLQMNKNRLNYNQTKMFVWEVLQLVSLESQMILSKHLIKAHVEVEILYILEIKGKVAVKSIVIVFLLINFRLIISRRKIIEDLKDI
jgi:hypothetical protein